MPAQPLPALSEQGMPDPAGTICRLFQPALYSVSRQIFEECMSEPTEIEDGEEYDVAPLEPLCLGAETVAILDADLLHRDSAVQGVIAVRVMPDLEIEYLDGETRLWVTASVPPGPRRKN